jgi:hypothetical protein
LALLLVHSVPPRSISQRAVGSGKAGLQHSAVLGLNPSSSSCRLCGPRQAGTPL